MIARRLTVQSATLAYSTAFRICETDARPHSRPQNMRTPALPARARHMRG